ncbi:hypothetical protein ACFVGM_34745 [Kitasatospora purpeofusca]|uniref:hypothetical protein n=1 Tax=Kitasatospora purpeofusca TaxID=67352 RepID=UPI0036C8EA57
MTRYSIDSDRHELIATWVTDEGDLATRVAALPSEAGTSVLLGLARALAQLSETAWRACTHPASAASSLEPNSEGWRRERERGHLGEVLDTMTKPNLPSRGSMVVSYSPLIESANRVGRALHKLADPGLTAAVLAETATEPAAVESVELGSRTQQAVLLSREDASPVQVAAADRLLEQKPVRHRRALLCRRPDRGRGHRQGLRRQRHPGGPGSRQHRGPPPRDPTFALGLIEDGATPYDVVTGLVRHAMHVADGLLPDPAGLREQLKNLKDALTEHTGDDEDDPEDTGLRLTLLDPPAPGPRPPRRPPHRHPRLLAPPQQVRRTRHCRRPRQRPGQERRTGLGTPAAQPRPPRLTG